MKLTVALAPVRRKCRSDAGSLACPRWSPANRLPSADDRRWRRRSYRVLHLAFRKTGMGADTLDGDGGAVGGKRLVFDVAGGFAVHRIGEVGAELFQVDLVDAAADLFVRREQDLDGAVLDLRIVDQELRGIHDLGDAGLVVGAQQCGAVRRDDVVADLVGQCGMVGGSNSPASCPPAARCRRHGNCARSGGLTSLPLQSGEVSMCEQKQITGTFLSELAGMVA